MGAEQMASFPPPWSFKGPVPPAAPSSHHPHFVYIPPVVNEVIVQKYSLPTPDDLCDLHGGNVLPHPLTLAKEMLAGIM